MTDTERQEVENLKRMAVGMVRICDRILEAHKAQVTVAVVCEVQPQLICDTRTGRFMAVQSAR